MNKKTIITIKALLIVSMLIIFVFSFSISQDEHHLETCKDEHCMYCMMIHIAQNLLSLAIASIIAIILGVLIYFFLSRLSKKQEAFIQSSLVFQKVQLNE